MTKTLKPFTWTCPRCREVVRAAFEHNLVPLSQDHLEHCPSTIDHNFYEGHLLTKYDRHWLEILKVRW